MSATTNLDPEEPYQRARVPDAPLVTPLFVHMVAMQLAFGFAFSVFTLLPKVLVASYDGTPSDIGLVQAAFAVACLISIPLVGRTVSALGHRNALVAANLLLAASAVAFVAIRSAGTLAVLLHGVQGLAWSLGFAAGMALVAEMAPPARLAQAIGLYGAAGLATNAVGPALAEPIAETLGPRAIFLLAGAAAVLGAAVSRRLPDDPPSTLRAGPRAGEPAPAAAPGTGGAAVYGLMAVVGLTFGVMFTFIAPFALARGVHTVSGFFLAYTAAALVVRAFTARLSDRIGHRRVGFVASAFYGLALASGGLFGPSHLVLLGAWFGAAHGALFPALMAQLLTGTSGPSRSRALALANGAMNAGLAGVYLLGVAAETLGYPAVFVLTGLFTVAAVAFAARAQSAR